jgi:hypothetical protein
MDARRHYIKVTASRDARIPKAKSKMKKTKTLFFEVLFKQTVKLSLLGLVLVAVGRYLP